MQASIYAWLWMEFVLKKSSIMSFNHIIIMIQLPHNSTKVICCIDVTTPFISMPIIIIQILEGWTHNVKISKWALRWRYQWVILYSRSEGWDLASDSAYRSVNPVFWWDVFIQCIISYIYTIEYASVGLSRDIAAGNRCAPLQYIMQRSSHAPRPH